MIEGGSDRPPPTTRALPSIFFFIRNTSCSPIRQGGGGKGGDRSGATPAVTTKCEYEIKRPLFASRAPARAGHAPLSGLLRLEQGGLLHDAEELLLGDLAVTVAVSLIDHLLELLVGHVLTELLSDALEVLEGDLASLVVVEEAEGLRERERSAHASPASFWIGGRGGAEGESKGGAGAEVRPKPRRIGRHRMCVRQLVREFPSPPPRPPPPAPPSSRSVCNP